jgi:hypothetical protein
MEHRRNDTDTGQPKNSVKNLSRCHSATKNPTLDVTGLKQGLRFEKRAANRLSGGRLRLKCNGTRERNGGEVKGKLANGVGSQYSSHYLGTWCIQHYYR